MSLVGVALLAAAVLTIAYFTYGRLLSRLLRLDPKVRTPAVELRDDLDYVPIESKFLLSQHFSAIAAAGPIVGPILAGIMFGWLPALIWILIGSIFIGGVHDITSLTASIRHRARSIADVVRENMSQRSYLMFLAFIWIALVYIIVAFADITAASFVGMVKLEDGTQVSGPGIASSSMLYLLLPIVMGLLLRYTRLSLNWATIIFLPLVGLTVYIGQYIPFELASMLGVNDDQGQKVWGVLLLVYCLIAAVAPMWLLLQPRGHLGGYFLYVALAAGFIGLLFGGQEIRYPAFTGWTSIKGETLFPFLFITIACGACSGFHSLIASGTTSKQLRLETDALPVGYGAMLLEAMVTVISLACVMILPLGHVVLNGSPNAIYGLGMGNMLEFSGISPALVVSFALMAFTTFVYDTLDVCTRLGRYIIQELLGWPGWPGRWIGTALTAGVPVFFIVQKTQFDAKGAPIPVWRTFWSLFGASNQLLAALTLLGVTVWLWKTRRAAWIWIVTGLPTVWMYVMSIWALVAMTWPKFWKAESGSTEFHFPSDPVPYAGLVLMALAAMMLIEAVLILWNAGGPPKQQAPSLGVPATT
ncbi:MAG: carbon starvation CstA family protein [Planctomycetota bacterium]|nr:carbon starvation CstA family protein [Planctomycetota bacterium]